MCTLCIYLFCKIIILRFEHNVNIFSYCLLFLLNMHLFVISNLSIFIFCVCILCILFYANLHFYDYVFSTSPITKTMQHNHLYYMVNI